jgi:thiol:disulfide interchange protein DsbA
MAAATVCIMPFFTLANPLQPEEPYTIIDPPLPSDTPDKIEVLEFFAYTCTHCAAMGQLVEDWAKNAPADVVLKKVPVAYNANMKPLQQLYYTLLALNRPDLHLKVFNAIHSENKRIFDKNAIGDWIETQGVDRATFDSVFDSFSVTTQMKRADELFAAYRLKGMPSFTVGGKYVTSPVMAGNTYEGALKEVDLLLPKVRGN